MSTVGVIYALECIGTNAVKIGFTQNHPKVRLQAMKGCSPFAYRLLGFANGTLGHEQEILRLLNDYRIRNEWFIRDGLVERFISMLAPVPP